MSARTTLASGRRRRKTITVLWIAVLAIVTVSLIYWEMTALLYILATLGVTALLIIVALSDLVGAEGLSKEISRADDEAAVGSSLTSTYGSDKS
jgi:heme O synthase-like polyprenyltransferase